MADTSQRPTSFGNFDAPAPSTPPYGDKLGKDKVERLADSAHGAVDRIADAAAPAVQKVVAGATQVGDAVHDRALHMRDLGDEWIHRARHNVRQHPLTSLVLAMVAGALIARISRRMH